MDTGSQHTYCAMHIRCIRVARIKLPPAADALYLDLFKRHFERERLIVVWIQRAFLYCRLLLLDSFSVHQQRQLHVRICTQTRQLPRQYQRRLD